MCTPCVHHEEPMSLDVTPNPISNSKLFPILLDPKSFQTALDYSSLSHDFQVTCLSLTLCPLQTNKILSNLCPANPNPSQSLSTRSSYNTLQCYSSFVMKIKGKEQYLFQRLPGYEIELKWLFGTIREKNLGKIVIKVYIIGIA